MRIITSDELGIIKVFHVESKELLAADGLDRPHREKKINALSFSLLEKQTYYNYFYAVRQDGIVQKYSIDHGSKERKKSASASLKCLSEFSSNLTDVLSVDDSGYSAHEDDERNESSNNDNVVVASSKSGRIFVSNGYLSKSFNVLGPIQASIAQATTIAVGGKDNDLKVYDIASTKCLWEAENVPNDELDLTVPIYISALAPLKPFKDDESLSLIVSGTGHKHIRLYDRRANNAPVQSVNIGEFRILSLKVTRDERKAIFGDTTGNVLSLDLRQMKQCKSYKKAEGAVKSLALHPSLPFCATAGLDRMCHIFNYETGELYSKIYLKQRATNVLFCEEGFTDDLIDDLTDEDSIDQNVEEYDMGSGSDSKYSDSEADSNENGKSSSLEESKNFSEDESSVGSNSDKDGSPSEAESTDSMNQSGDISNSRSLEDSADAAFEESEENSVETSNSNERKSTHKKIISRTSKSPNESKKRRR